MFFKLYKEIVQNAYIKLVVHFTKRFEHSFNIYHSGNWSKSKEFAYLKEKLLNIFDTIFIMFIYSWKSKIFNYSHLTQKLQQTFLEKPALVANFANMVNVPCEWPT